MKHVVLLRDDRSHWDDVAKSLLGANVKVSSPVAEWAPEDVIGLSPDMIVTSLLNLSHLKISLRRIPKVAIQTSAQEAHLIPASTLEWNMEIVKWPAEKHKFLQVTSQQLAISPRKHFACIFQAFTDGDDALAIAQTVNLSMTGLAFKSIAEFEVGQGVRITLALPGESARLEARVRIVRSAEDDSGDPRITYGAEYLDPSDEFMRSMKRFIHTY